MRLHLLLLLPLAAGSAAAQAPAAPAGGATINGVVRDSLARRPLADAVVQLAAVGSALSFSRTVNADSLGRFVVADVPDGRYVVGFFHPLLDSLGVSPTERQVVVSGGQAPRVELATPGPRAMRTAICGVGGAAVPDDAGLAMGVVRDAEGGLPVADARVTAEWVEYTLGRGASVERKMPRLTAKTGENGWFAICGVPTGGTLALSAARGGDSTDVIELQVPAEGFLRRELHLGASRVVAVAGDSGATVKRRGGQGRLRGVVVTAADGRPLANVRVALVDGPQTRTDERGEWTLAGAPLGTRVLEVRAVGFYPDRRGVDVTASAPPVRVALSTVQAVLDTVRVIAGGSRSRDLAGFEERRRSGQGYALDAAQIARRNALETSDIFRAVPGIRIDGSRGAVESPVLIRGAFGLCSPDLYVDNMYIPGSPATAFGEEGATSTSSVLTTDDIDAVVSPDRIAGIEVYRGATAPPQFRHGMGECGSIVIWTKLRDPKKTLPTPKQP